ncbi:GntR family transcriptional regulator [Lentilactobacillus parabuchneri]|jgi:DNA-binding GntR family transcriptional regulator|uniref:GntR family transcriptional regulator n=1 Tax=Lentilactobacillus parabuchneri TaxID=152331 RepID=UPI003991A550
MTSNRQEVYQALRQAIITGELTSGEPIADRVLADRYQVSRTPVREALRQLSAEGFVDVIPNIGTRVAVLPAEQLVPSIMLLGRLEQAAVEMMVTTATKADVKALKAINEDYRQAIVNQDWHDAMTADRQFHDYLISRCGSDYAAQFSDLLFAQLQSYEQSYFKERLMSDLTAYERHQKLIKAIKAGKAKKAGKLMRQQWLAQIEGYETQQRKATK